MDIKTIILKSIYGQLTAEEKQFLDRWLAVDNHQQLYERIRTNIIKMQAVEHLAAIDVERALKNVKLGDNRRKEIDKPDHSHDRDSNSKNAHTSRFAILNSHLYRVAAVLVLLIVGGTFWYREHTRVTPPTISEEVQTAMQLSRKSGRAAAKVEAVNNQQSSPVTQEVRQLYHVDEQFAEQLAEAKRITTYQDKEYWVTLEDGTLVHLNYNSRLIYPEKFGDRRDVILDGEAYFMVAKDKSRQFVVHTPKGDVKVYGTEFVVNTGTSTENGNDNKELTVVLVKGSVSFTPTDGREKMLTPGQELSIVNSQLNVSEVDTAPFVAWNEGEFVFSDWTLERIMSVIARWYGLDVEFANKDLGNHKFSGSLSRYEDLKPTLETIEMVTGMRLNVNNQKLYINLNK